MNVKRYFAPTAREALRALKAELGADAIVLSNKAVDGGVEILALPADDIGALQSGSGTVREPAPVRKPETRPPFENSIDDGFDDDYRVSLTRARQSSAPQAPAAQRVRQPDPAPEVRAFAPRPSPSGPAQAGGRVIQPWSPPRVEEPPPEPLRVEAPRARREAPRFEAARSERELPEVSRIEAALRAQREEDEKRIRELQETNTRLMAELSGIRGMIERQLAGFAWGEIGRNAPERMRMMAVLLEAGFSASLARRLTDEIAAGAGPDDAHTLVKKTLNRSLRVLSSDADIIDRGGVYALVGPTGVGKTTTTAKLAARCVVRHGASKLALITTDGYRIGAQEQLKIYGRILGVPVFAVKDGADLRQTLAELRGKHMVLIDTVGVSQRDRMVADQAAMLLGAGNVHRLLLLNATVRGDTLDDVVSAYDGPDLIGCILSKVDEAASLAPALDVAVRHELGVFYVANGQRVPEDLHLPNRAYLLHRALKALPEDSAYRLDEDQAGLLMAAGGTGV